MDRKEFQEFFEKNQGKFFPGIYNYCDRWCERCNFTSKCSSYALEAQSGNKADDENEGFINQVSENFKIVMEMLLEMAEEKGIDLNAIDDEAFAKEEELLETFAKNHSLSAQSMDYSTLVRNWFDQNEATLQKLSEKMKQTVELGLVNEDTLNKFDSIKDAVEIIRWYCFQIHVKLIRALRHGEPDFEYEDHIQNDANGSAKVALIGTERSLGAWGVLHRQLPEQEDELLNILLLLEKIRKGIFKTFPDVNKFIRPGFDE
jgi:gas vesicle protein